MFEFDTCFLAHAGHAKCQVCSVGFWIVFPGKTLHVHTSKSVNPLTPRSSDVGQSVVLAVVSVSVAYGAMDVLVSGAYFTVTRERQICTKLQKEACQSKLSKNGRAPRNCKRILALVAYSSTIVVDDLLASAAELRG